MFLQHQQVVCIDDEFPKWVHGIYKELPQKDHCYTVRSVLLGASSSGDKCPTPSNRQEDVAILVKELHNPEMGNPPQEAGFLASRFVPLTELSEEEILRITQPEEQYV
jgi:hypothetical protein